VWLGLILTIVVLGLIAWAVRYLPLPAPFGTIVQVILIVVLVLVLLQAFGLIPATLPVVR
jgi:hypothetical protein